MRKQKNSFPANESRTCFGKISFYDTSDIDAQAEKAYNSSISEEELKRKRGQDWLWILICIPLLIGTIYLIALLTKAGK